MAVTLAQPTDVVKVRFQAQVCLPESGSVKRYSSTIEAYKTIARDEGIKGLWKGKLKWGNKLVKSFVILFVIITHDLQAYFQHIGDIIHLYCKCVLDAHES